MTITPTKAMSEQATAEARDEHGMSDAALELIARDARARTYAEWLWMVEEIQRLRVLLREREREALERAAKVAEAERTYVTAPGRPSAPERIAAAIRALVGSVDRAEAESK
jgi:hypothetical protein